MINVRSTLKGRNKTAEINISPMIDLVFLLLIFFMVTTSFVKETGIDVQRPGAVTASMSENSTILIGISKDDNVFMDGKKIDMRSVRANVTRAIAEDPNGAVMIVADKASNTGAVIKVMDQCKMAGAKNVSIAADNGSRG